MRILFRVDASKEIGVGHLMRCLTLAKEFVRNGCEVHFLCFQLGLGFHSLIKEQGHELHLISDDSYKSLSLIQSLKPHVVVVDHYGLDREWELECKQSCESIFVIDDLADRPHQSDWLLDQTYGRHEKDYSNLVGSDCDLLIGPHYALLRPEFAQNRSEALERRKTSDVKSLLISMGGTDPLNMTSQILEHLQKTKVLAQLDSVMVMMGSQAPNLNDVRELSSELSVSVSMHVDSDNVSGLMTRADFCIGASGSTTWERCCLGLPTLQIQTAQNQEYALKKLTDYKIVVGFHPEDLLNLDHKIKTLLDDYQGYVERCSSIIDGKGVSRVAQQILSKKGS